MAMTKAKSGNEALEAARHMGDIYKTAIDKFSAGLDGSFSQAVDMLMATDGHVIVAGMGKSGLFGRKISSTLASTGTPAIFLHPAEAIHGDLGKVRKEDVLVMISHSGETEEILRLIAPIKRLGVKMIAMTGDTGSTLASHADTVLDIAVDREACPLNLAPTTSGLMTLVMGDALAIALMEKRDFKPEDFARTHPGGSLGRRLLSMVSENMVTENLPFVKAEDQMKDVIVAMTQGRLGIALVGAPDKLEGIITDGDLRRAIGENADVINTPAREVMTADPLTVRPDTSMGDAEQRMQEARIQCLVVTDDGKTVGVVQIF
jgi:arabinose-5-phosphate isomerase